MGWLKKFRLTTIVLYSMLIVTSISIAIVGYLWIDQRTNQFKLESQKLRDDFIKEQKKVIKEEVEKAINYVDFMKSNTNSRLRQTIKNRVYEAYDIALNLYKQNKGKLSDERIQTLIKDALRPIRFNNGRGYYFATRLDGIEMLFADRPEMEGVNMLGTRDTQGKYVIRDMINIARTQKEGFYSYTWTMPDVKGKDFKKTAYIKHFEPFDWFIGTGEYFEDVEKDIQQEALDWFINVRFSNNGYLFGSKFNGDPLFTNGKITEGSQNIWDLTDPNGVKVIQAQKLVATQPEGGFYEYSWIKLNGTTPSPKVSFSKSIPDWEWMVGAGVYTDNIDRVINERRSHLTDSIKKDIKKILLVLFGLIFIVYLFARYLSRLTKQGFDRFTSFFNSASTTLAKIDQDDVGFSEFSTLVEIANQMVDARLMAEAALIESEKKYRGVVENASEAICVIQNNQFQFLNPAAERLFGYSPSEFARIPVTDTIHPEDAESTLRQLQTADLKTQVLSFRVFKKDGETREVSAKAETINWNDQPAILVLLTDVTDQKRSNELMIQYEKIMSLGGLAAGMAHELNNPLSGMILGVQSIERRLLQDSSTNRTEAKTAGIDLNGLHQYMRHRKIDSLIKGVKDSGKKAAQIIASTLQFSRKSGSRQTECDLVVLVENVLELAGKDYDLKKKYDFRSIRIEREFEADLPKVSCVETEIEQVILNLIKNAAYAVSNGESSKEQQVIIRLKRRSHSVQIEVEDNGPGMEKATLKRVFEPFYTTKPVGEGTGLGLSVSYLIITNNHEGTIEVESKPGKGTRFIIQLPLKIKTISEL